MGRGTAGGGFNGDGSIQRHPRFNVTIEFKALDHEGLDECIQRDKALLFFSINKAMMKRISSRLLTELGLHEAMLKSRQQGSRQTSVL